MERLFLYASFLSALVVFIGPLFVFEPLVILKFKIGSIHHKLKVFLLLWVISNVINFCLLPLKLSLAYLTTGIALAVVLFLIKRVFRQK
jgi:hypothetical protein